MKVLKMLKNKFGFSLGEILLAICLFAIFTVGIAYLSLDTLDRNSKIIQNNEALFYAQEGIEATRNIRDKNYLFLTNGDHGLNFENNEWSFGLAPETIDNFYKRIITVSDVYRDVEGNIDPEGDVFDMDTKKIEVKIEWSQKEIIPRSITLTEYMSNWKRNDWLTTTREEFNAGTFDQTEVRDIEEGSSGNDGGIVLVEIDAKNDFYSSANVGHHAHDVVVDGNYAYLATNDAQKGLNIIDITNPATPKIVSSVYLAGGKGVYIKKNGDYIYESIMDATKGFAIINVANPTNPFYTKIIKMSRFANSIDTKDNYIYVGIDKASKGLKVYDVTSKTAPILKKTIIFPDAVRAIKIDGNNAYVGLYDDRWGLRVLNISDPLNIIQINASNVGEEVNAMAISGNILFIGTETRSGHDYDDYYYYYYYYYYNYYNHHGRNSLKVVDISSPQHPVLLTSIDTGGQIRDLAIFGDYLYAAVDRTRSGLAVINISNPYSPYLAYAMDVGGRGEGIDSDGNYIYIATGTSNKGLVIVGAVGISVSKNGTYTSDIFDTGNDDTIYNFIEWDSQAAAGGSVKFQIKTAGTPDGLESATWVGSDGTNATYYEIPRTIIALDEEKTGDRYFQYKVFLTSDGSSSPAVSSVRINYTP